MSLMENNKRTMLWTEQACQQLISSPTDPVGKFLREMELTAADVVRLGLMSELEEAPRKCRLKYGKRKSLTEAERVELSRERNREHAKSTRRRKKVFVSVLEKKLLQLETAVLHRFEHEGMQQELWRRQREDNAALLFVLLDTDMITSTELCAHWETVALPDLSVTLQSSRQSTSAFPSIELCHGAVATLHVLKGLLTRLIGPYEPQEPSHSSVNDSNHDKSQGPTEASSAGDVGVTDSRYSETSPTMSPWEWWGRGSDCGSEELDTQDLLSTLSSLIDDDMDLGLGVSRACSSENIISALAGDKATQLQLAIDCLATSQESLAHLAAPLAMQGSRIAVAQESSPQHGYTSTAPTSASMSTPIPPPATFSLRLEPHADCLIVQGFRGTCRCSVVLSANGQDAATLTHPGLFASLKFCGAPDVTGSDKSSCSVCRTLGADAIGGGCLRVAALEMHLDEDVLMSMLMSSTAPIMPPIGCE